MIKQQLFIGAALIAGVAVGYFIRPEGAKAVDAATDHKRVEIADNGDKASIKALRTRIAELERMLAESAANKETAISNAVDAVRKAPPGPWGNHRERLEKLKETDPERYNQITNRMSKWRQRNRERIQRRSEFLSSIDTSGMSERARQNHESLQNLLAKRESLDEKMHDGDLTEEQRRSIMEEMRSTDHELRKLNRSERDALLGEMTKPLGFGDEDAAEIKATISDVIEATNDMHGMPPPPPPSDKGTMR